MILTLEVIGSQAEKLGTARRKTFDETGGTIGRHPKSSWFLPDPERHLSNKHAVISYNDGVFSIEDTSTNGVCVNSQDNRLVKGKAHPLKSGDWIFIEPYEIRASISEASEDSQSPFSELFPPPVEAAPADRMHSPAAGRSFEPPTPASRLSVPIVNPFPDEIDESDREHFNQQYGFRPLPPSPNAPKAVDLSSQSALNDSFLPVKPVDPPPTPTPMFDDQPPPGYNPLEDSGVIPSPPAPPKTSPSRATRHGRRGGPSGAALPGPARRPVAPPASASAPPENGQAIGASLIDLREVLRGAGLQDLDVPPELARNFGEILETVVAGVIDLLEARRDLKREFRMDLTVYGRSANNPLKLSVNVADALHNLLVKRNPAFVGPVEAFRDAFQDLRNHQMAMLMGMHVAFEAMLAAFDPDRLQADFDRQGTKGALLSKPAKLRYWEMYRQKFREMVKDSEKCYDRLFGDQFAEAYEEQLKRLAGQDRDSEPQR